MKKHIITSTLLALIISIIAVYSHTNTRPDNNNEQIVTNDTQIVIGFIGPLTGEASFVGLPNKAIVEYAVNKINSSGGIGGKNVKIIFEDGQCDQKTSISAIRKLIEVDSVNYVIGGYCSTESIAIAPIAKENTVIVFSPTSSHPDLSDAGEYFFRNYPSDAYQGVFTSEFFIESGFTRAVVVAGQTDYSQGVADKFMERFEIMGGSVLYKADASMEERDFRSIATKIKSLNPDVIYAPTSTLKQGISLIRQLREINIVTPVVGPESWNDKDLLAENKDVLENVMYTTIDSPEIPDEIIQGMKKYCPTCGTGPGIAQSYDAVMILSQAIKKSGDNTEQVKNELLKTKYKGAGGLTEFDKNGDLINNTYKIRKL